MNSTADLTLVVPLYNEIENLPRLFGRLAAYRNDSKWGVTILLVDDGSTDGGDRLIVDYCGTNEGFGYLLLDRNYGLSSALKAGFDHSCTPYTGYIDADLQTDPYEIDLLMEHAGRYDLVTGSRTRRNDGWVKKISSRMANSIRRAVTHDGVNDTGCPLKVIRTPMAQKIPFFKGMHRFIPALVLMAGGTILEIPVSHYPRQAGTAKYHLWNRLTGPALDLFGYRWMKSRYINYTLKQQG